MQEGGERAGSLTGVRKLPLCSPKWPLQALEEMVRHTERAEGALARAVGTRPGGQGALRTGKDRRILDTQLQWAGIPSSSPPSGQAAGLRGFPWPSLRAWGAALKPRYGIGGTYPEVGSQPGNGVCGRVLLREWLQGTGLWAHLTALQRGRWALPAEGVEVGMRDSVSSPPSLPQGPMGN